MKHAIATVLAALATVAMAGQPGDRITWEDVVTTVPGLATEPFLSALPFTECEGFQTTDSPPPDLRCGFQRTPFNTTIDASGSVYFWDVRTDAQSGLPVYTIWRTRADGMTQSVARIEARQSSQHTDFAGIQETYVDIVQGYLYVKLSTGCTGVDCSYDHGQEIFRIVGLPTVWGALRGNSSPRRGRSD